jgi:hypothetical protein
MKCFSILYNLYSSSKRYIHMGKFYIVFLTGFTKLCSVFGKTTCYLPVTEGTLPFLRTVGLS